MTIILFLVSTLSVGGFAQIYNNLIPETPYNYQRFYNPVGSYAEFHNGERYIRGNIGLDIEPNLGHFTPNLSPPSQYRRNSYHHNEQNSAPLITKDVFIHAPPDEPDDPQPQYVDFGPTRKHYRIIFIKAPETSRRKSITLAEPKREEKTIIYVLSKKTDSSDVEAILQPSPVKSSKPEVFFVKYKTSEEAAYAQQKIQEQYNSLGGTTQVDNEETAPIVSDVSLLKEPNLQQSEHQTTKSENEDFLSSDNESQYLPPVK